MNEQPEDFCPTCDKCGAPVTTALMGAICPRREQCEFWTPEIKQFIPVAAMSKEQGK